MLKLEHQSVRIDFEKETKVRDIKNLLNCCIANIVSIAIGLRAAFYWHICDINRDQNQNQKRQPQLLAVGNLHMSFGVQ